MPTDTTILTRLTGLHLDDKASEAVSLDFLTDDAIQHILELGYQDLVDEECATMRRNQEGHGRLPLKSEGRNFAIRISHICKRLRSIALDTPNIWTLISMAYTHPQELSTLLIRSKQTGLTIAFRNMRREVANNHLEAFLECVCQHKARWNRLFIPQSAPITVHEWLSNLPDPVFPLLQELFYYRSLFNPYAKDVSAPKWRLPVLSVYAGDAGLPEYNPVHLHALEIQFDPINVAGYIGRLCDYSGMHSSLTTLCLSSLMLSIEEVDIPGFEQCIEFPNLKILQYNHTHATGIVWRIFAVIRAPVLKSLYLHVEPTLVNDHEVSTHDLLQCLAHFPTLLSLGLTHVGAEPLSLDMLMQILPRVVVVLLKSTAILPILKSSASLGFHHLHKLTLKSCTGMTEEYILALYNMLYGGQEETVRTLISQLHDDGVHERLRVMWKRILAIHEVFPQNHYEITDEYILKFVQASNSHKHFTLLEIILSELDRQKISRQFIDDLMATDPHRVSITFPNQGGEGTL